mmetsp:Transcript_734/g.2913  ORF Transcript_734/g.2913 Transcript_734/m.2913 type:complete len:288 (+) Transcript_734:184-1047(+)
MTCGRGMVPTSVVLRSSARKASSSNVTPCSLALAACRRSSADMCRVPASSVLRSGMVAICSSSHSFVGRHDSQTTSSGPASCDCASSPAVGPDCVASSRPSARPSTLAPAEDAGACGAGADGAATTCAALAALPGAPAPAAALLSAPAGLPASAAVLAPASAVVAAAEAATSGSIPAVSARLPLPTSLAALECPSTAASSESDASHSRREEACTSAYMVSSFPVYWYCIILARAVMRWASSPKLSGRAKRNRGEARMSSSAPSLTEPSRDSFFTYGDTLLSVARKWP